MFEYYVKEITKIVDGDTVDVVIDLGFDISFTTRVRLAGIDTPESRTKDLAEKALGLESKAYLASILEGAENIVIKTEKINSTEKFGRVLGWLYVNGEIDSVNSEMINKGYAWKYLGDTKLKDFDELKAKRAINS
jgi:micrococcal nuclease